MSLDQDIDRLAGVPLLAALEPDALRLLAFAGETRSLPAGTALFRRGEPSDGGYLVVSGTILVTDEVYQAVRVGPAGLLAETALLRDTVHARSAVAQDPATVFKLPRTAMLRVLEAHPASATRLLAFLARRLHATLPRDGLGS
ncbi:cyclic nucleotide-binding domain-containing protein [Lichenihabitans sp. Uapishka_5]|uniref:cyclic nucleotide-binding domain-containing protein n=1 Tax=Lichenihabitans sp. Uapishka_5 TaxID=3037302 RepID=UPI0029E7F2C4|nr:cyclic nucleotide-binding domain-containing protein [Lichenihabitans sp. Uapishka_5]MDX7950436.1 cyclic nucleotide-binding domain-containing protein [Lichenihabitans sp. Uapishka_5]